MQGVSTFALCVSLFTLVAVFLGITVASISHAETRTLAYSQDHETLFDGKSLNGWKVLPPERRRDWYVQDGMIVGRGSADGLCYLVWHDANLCDFELDLEYRLPDRGNTGIEIRARKDPTGRRPLVGYHADLGHVGIGPHILGAWDFHFDGRDEPPCPRGTSLVIFPDGRTVTKRLPNAVGPDDIRVHDWNSVRVVIRGFHGVFYINGKIASEFTDLVRDKRFRCGSIGLQIHDKGMEVHFRNIRLKRIPPREQQCAEAHAGNTSVRGQ